MTGKQKSPGDWEAESRTGNSRSRRETKGRDGCSSRASAQERGPRSEDRENEAGSNDAGSTQCVPEEDAGPQEPSESCRPEEASVGSGAGDETSSRPAERRGSAGVGKSTMAGRETAISDDEKHGEHGEIGDAARKNANQHVPADAAVQLDKESLAKEGNEKPTFTETSADILHDAAENDKSTVIPPDPPTDDNNAAAPRGMYSSPLNCMEVDRASAVVQICLFVMLRFW